MIQSTVTSKGQTTLPKAVREALGLVPGDKVRFLIVDNEVRILPVRPLKSLAGALKRDGAPVSTDEMEAAIHAGRAGRAQR